MLLPTVELRHRRSGDIRIVNQTDYARDIAAYRDYEILSLKGGDASDEEVRLARQQSEVELVRRRNPASPAAQDEARAQAARALTLSSVAAPAEAPADWRHLNWFAARQHVRRLTGVLPKDKAHAEALMRTHAAR
jgi:hypothetical protein